MSPDLAAVRRKAHQLIALAESTTFEGERQNARDAYFRLCDANRLDPRTLEPLDAEPTPSSDEGWFQPPQYMAEFWAAQIANPRIDFREWLSQQLKERRRSQTA